MRNRGTLRAWGTTLAALACVAVDGSTAAASEADRVAAALQDHPSGVLTGALGDEPPAAGEGHVVGYPATNVAAVVTGGHRGYVVSTQPLITDGEPVSLRLQSAGQLFRAEDAPIEASVDPATGTFSLQAPGQPAIRVARAGASRPQSAEIVEGRAVLAHGGDSADTAVQVTATGAETFELLPSAEAASTLRWNVDLPSDWRIQAAAGAAEIRDGHDAVMYRVTAPWAMDASGQPVDLQVRVEDERTIAVDVLATDATYPVVVDPDWASTYDWAAGHGAAGWLLIDEPVPGTNPLLGYTSTFTGLGSLPGLWIWPTGSMTQDYVNVGGDGQEVRGGARFEAPGTTRIKRVQFADTTWELQQENCATGNYRDVDQYLRFVLRDRTTNATTDETQIGGPGGTGATRNVVSPTSVPLVDPNQAAPSSTSASLTMWTIARTTASPKTIFPNPRPANAGCIDSASPFVRVPRVDVTLVDNDDPVVEEISGEIRDWSGQAATAWLGPNATREAGGTIKVRDAGAGIDVGEGSREPTTKVLATNRFGGSLDFDISGGARCVSGHQPPATDGRLCPERVTTLLDGDRLDLGRLLGNEIPAAEQDGPWDLTLHAKDLVGHQLAPDSSPVRIGRYFVDTQAPTISQVTINGDDGDLRNRWIRASSAYGDQARTIRLAATASDPVAGPPGAQVASGILGVELLWEQAGVGQRTLLDLTEDTCVAGSGIEQPCQSTRTPDAFELPRHLPGGQFTARARARDFVHNDGADAEASTWVDDAAPTVSLSGALADLDGAWIAPSGAATLRAEATDPAPWAGGLRSVRVRVNGQDGTPVEPATELVSCTTTPATPGAPAPPSPLCPATADETLTVDTSAWPHGRVDVQVDASDVVGNARRVADPDVVVHVDRKAPKAELSGELVDLATEGGWQAPEGDITARVRATDEGSGILRLELWAKDEQGSRKIDEVATCTPPATTSDDTPPCPTAVLHTFQIDPALVGDGKATFEARAVEYTGRIARVRETVLLDDTPPPPVEGLRIERVLASAVGRWDQPAISPDSAPITGYIYAVYSAGQTVVDWTTTPTNAAPLPVMPPGVALELHVCTVEDTGKKSECRIVADRQGAKTDVVKELGLDDFEKMWGDDSYKRLVADAERRVGSKLGSMTRTLAKGLSRAGIAAAVVAPLVWPEETSCAADLGWVEFRKASVYRFGLTFGALYPVPQASYADVPRLQAKLRVADQKLDLLLREAREVVQKYGKDETCARHAQVAGHAVHVLDDATDVAVDHLGKIPRPPAVDTKRKRRRCTDREANRRRDSAFRWNLCWFTGREGAKETPKREAHHVLPQWRVLLPYWAKVGLNYHHPEFMCWMEYQQHRDTITGFNNAWRRWWDFKDDSGRTRHDRALNNDYWKSGVLKQALALTKAPGTGANNYRCQFPPTRRSIRPRLPWPVDVGQPVDFKP